MRDDGSKELKQWNGAVLNLEPCRRGSGWASGMNWKREAREWEESRVITLSLPWEGTGMEGEDGVWYWAYLV